MLIKKYNILKRKICIIKQLYKIVHISQYLNQFMVIPILLKLLFYTYIKIHFDIINKIQNSSAQFLS